MNKKWQTLKSSLDYENPFMRITKHDIKRPNDTQGVYYVLQRQPCSIIIPITPDQQTYLIGQYRFAISQYSWEFPMGSVPNKAPLEVAKQELQEETGMTAEFWEHIGQNAVAPGHNSQFTHVFVAKDLKSGTATPEVGEILELKKVPLSAVGEMIERGEIVDGLTICAYHYLEVYLKKSK